MVFKPCSSPCVGDAGSFLFYFPSGVRGEKVIRSYEIQHGLIYVYINRQLSHILHDSPALRADLDARGYVWHNKHER